MPLENLDGSWRAEIKNKEPHSLRRALTTLHYLEQRTKEPVEPADILRRTPTELVDAIIEQRARQSAEQSFFQQQEIDRDLVRRRLHQAGALSAAGAQREWHSPSSQQLRALDGEVLIEREGGPKVSFSGEAVSRSGGANEGEHEAEGDRKAALHTLMRSRAGLPASARRSGAASAANVVLAAAKRRALVEEALAAVSGDDSSPERPTRLSPERPPRLPRASINGVPELRTPPSHRFSHPGFPSADGALPAASPAGALSPGAVTSSSRPLLPAMSPSFRRSSLLTDSRNSPMRSTSLGGTSPTSRPPALSSPPPSQPAPPVLAEPSPSPVTARAPPELSLVSAAPDALPPLNLPSPSARRQSSNGIVTPLLPLKPPPLVRAPTMEPLREVEVPPPQEPELPQLPPPSPMGRVQESEPASGQGPAGQKAGEDSARSTGGGYTASRLGQTSKKQGGKSWKF
ncbi:hypothetical protein HYH03_004837 [Edaphochlamys debaryana]|uniref:Uncharacterized protein n=1 Tax=Edaphochlamys debaryana TaxID=47281 RepID=A0A835Y736_9CHLO|nr:hypothetical protein HYH03_004837 [Edaphochlamys debaryana]|eukprot:KAG2497253.1 hypothetical protein HYH03_004837 [Edaphochlamys debaryana]